MKRDDIRLALPSKGRLKDEALGFLKACGLGVYMPNPRQYQAIIPAVPAIKVIFQRPGDIVSGVLQGSLDFGIAGLDMVAEKQEEGNAILVLHDALGFGHCYLGLAVPEDWESTWAMEDLATLLPEVVDAAKGLRVATKFPYLTCKFLAESGIEHFTLIEAEGTLEVAPAIGYADIIADLVSTGTTLRDNRLRPLADGVIIRSQAALIANRGVLQSNKTAMAVARELLEYFEAHLRARENYLVVANMRGDSPEAIAGRMFTQTTLGGLQGPTIAPVFNPNGNGERWHSISIVVHKENLTQAIADLRKIGGSGVIVSPVTYIFEEEPACYRRLVEAIKEPLIDQSGGMPA
jgi:ATP phosphoribosyltransferase